MHVRGLARVANIKLETAAMIIQAGDSLEDA
jgi:hypothetical protein